MRRPPKKALRADVAHWQQQAAEIAADANWNSLDAKFAPQLEASKAQLLVVSDAFHQALAQAVGRGRGCRCAAAARAGVGRRDCAWRVAARPRRRPPRLRQAARALQARRSTRKSGPRRRPPSRRALAKLEQETAEGHGKASAGAAAALRAVLKEHGKLVDAGARGAGACRAGCRRRTRRLAALER